MSETTFRLMIRKETIAFGENKVLLADLQHKAEQAGRTRKISRYGYDSVDVFNATYLAIMERFNLGQSLQDIVDDQLRRSTKVFPDTTTPEAHNVAFAKLVAASAERIIYRHRLESPVGDATAVVGEEVPTEQRELSAEEAARGNDRQKAAILARKAKYAGIHRADVYGVADSSRETMRDVITQSFKNEDKEVTSILMDSMWSPRTEVQQEAWNIAFGDELPCSVLFGVDPATGEMRHDEASTGAMIINGLVSLIGGSDMPMFSDDPATVIPGVNVPNLYPRNLPYVPLQLRTNRTERPERLTNNAKAKCMHCAHFDPKNPWRIHGAKVTVALNRAEQAKAFANPDYKPTLYVQSSPGKTCPPGKVNIWGQLIPGRLLPEGYMDSTKTALHRALENFAQMVMDGRRRHWTDKAVRQVALAEYRAYREDRNEVGQGIWIAPAGTKLSDWTNQASRPFAPDEEITGKEARRFSIMANMSETDIFDAFSIDLAMPRLGDTATPYLPGAERRGETSLDMMRGWVKVEETGNMVWEGVYGTFVDGLPGVLEYQRNVQYGRNVVDALIRLKSLIWFGV